MAGGGSNTIRLRLNIMTALYLPILLYAMSTFDLDEDALVLNSDNLKPHVISNSGTLALGDSYQASLMFTLQNDIQRNSSNDIFRPKIKIDYDNSPSELRWDSAREALVMDTEKLFDGVNPDTLTKNVHFSGTIIGRTANDIQNDNAPSYIEDFEGSFTVFRPVIQVQSNAEPKLLSNCLNALSFNVTGVNSSELFVKEKFTNNTFEGNSISFSPSTDTSAIQIYRQLPSGNQNLLGEKGFKVVEPPNPAVFIRKENSNTILQPGEQIGLFETYEVVIKANESFANEYPDDARYSLDNVTVEINRRGLAPEIAEFTREELEYDDRNEAIGEFIYKFSILDEIANPNGTGVSIFVENLARINYEGKPFPIDQNVVPSQFIFNTL